MNTVLRIYLLLLVSILPRLACPSQCTVILAAIAFERGAGSVEELESFVRSQAHKKSRESGDRLSTEQIVNMVLGWAYKNHWPPSEAWAQQIGPLLDKFPRALEVLERRITEIQQFDSFALTSHDETQLAGEWPLVVRGNFAYDDVVVELKDGRKLKGKLQPAAGWVSHF